jgi:predicted acylesterase/phospholipase RssA/CRP-like cAMP-binding protein
VSSNANLQRDRFAAAALRLFGALGDAALARLEALAEWVEVRRSQFLFHEGEASDGVYVVASGRMLVVRERGGSCTILGEARTGETLGEMSFFLHEPRSAGALAARDTLLIRFPNDAFDTVITAHPELVRELLRVQFARLRRSGDTTPTGAIDVAIVALGDDVPLREFAARLAAATTTFGSTLLLDAETVDRSVGAPGISRLPESDPMDPMLVAWLNQQESQYRFVVYQTDPGVSEWTERCIRQADRVILLANANGDPSLHAVETLLDDSSRVGAPRRMLVLLHSDGSRATCDTSAWLRARRVDEHHHLRTDSDADFARLARFLAGRAIGLVLGGGGARGFAHIGVLRAMRDANVPIDMVGGTSMGASMAAQYALGWSPKRMLEENRRVWVKLRPQKHYTLPMISVLSAKMAQRYAKLMYGDTQIEDLWLRFYCVSSDLSRASAIVHESGSLLTALTASAAVAGIIPPVLVEGRLLCDGAFLNNVPADVMRERGCGRVIASEVTVEEDEAFTCERVPTPWEIVRGKLRRKRVKFPSIVEIMLRASMLASSRKQDDAVRSADLVFHPPINEFGLLEFDAIERLEQVGYDHARAQIEEWRASGAL